MLIRKAIDRGVSNFGWLDSRHSFSFGEYYDPRFMGFGPLRVINDDRVAPGRGFGTHPHADMEIVSYVLAGALEHKDSLGNGSVIRPGDVQRMSAGTGITHSEFNPSATEPVHFLQIWFLPHSEGLPPSYAQKHFPPEQKQGRLCLVASRDGREGSISLQQDVDMYAALLNGESVMHNLEIGRKLWLQVATGELVANGHPLSEGDGIGLEEGTLRLEQGKEAEILLFDMG